LLRLVLLRLLSRRGGGLDHRLAVARVEAPHPFLTAGCDELAVPAGRYCLQGGRAPPVSLLGSPGIDAPLLSPMVPARGEERVRLADEHQPRDLLLVRGDGPGLLALLVVPHLDIVIRPAGGQELPVRLPADVQDVVRMPLERLEELARRDFPNLHELVGPARR